MFRVIFFAGILLSATPTYADKDMEVLSDIIKNDQWAVAEGTHNDLPLMIRFRNKLGLDSSASNPPQLTARAILLEKGYKLPELFSNF